MRACGEVSGPTACPRVLSQWLAASRASSTSMYQHASARMRVSVCRSACVSACVSVCQRMSSTYSSMWKVVMLYRTGPSPYLSRPSITWSDTQAGQPRPCSLNRREMRVETPALNLCAARPASCRHERSTQLPSTAHSPPLQQLPHHSPPGPQPTRSCLYYTLAPCGLNPLSTPGRARSWR